MGYWSWFWWILILHKISFNMVHSVGDRLLCACRITGTLVTFGLYDRTMGLSCHIRRITSEGKSECRCRLKLSCGLGLSSLKPHSASWRPVSYLSTMATSGAKIESPPPRPSFRGLPHPLPSPGGHRFNNAFIVSPMLLRHHTGGGHDYNGDDRLDHDYV